MIAEMEELLKKQGWYVSSSKIEELVEEGTMPNNNNNNNVENLIKMLLDLDLNCVGFQNKTENGNVARPKAETLCGPLVLQIQRVRNVSAPKANETSHTAPQLLKVTVTDGSSVYQILQIGKWNSVTLDTPPGTKLQLKAGNTCKVVCGFVPLKQNQFCLIGGGVHGLYEKWQLTKAYSMNNRQRESGAPKWVPFGQNITNLHIQDNKADFKSLETDAKQLKENEAFDQQRQANIEEIAKAFDVKKKSFMKNKPPISNASGERTRGDQRQFDRQSSAGSGGRHGRHEASADSNRGRPERKPHSRREEREDQSTQIAPSKPSTLFDFLTNKLGDEGGTKDPALNTLAKSTSVSDSYHQQQQHLPSGRSKGDDWGRDERGGRRNQPPSTYPPSGSGSRPRNDFENNYMNSQQQQYFSHKPVEDRPQHNFQNGDKVLAKYWEDQKVHRAQIAAMGETGRTCVIRFVDYDNYEEVLLTDVQPCSPQKWDNFRTGMQQRSTFVNPQNPRHQNPANQGGWQQDPGPGVSSGGEGGNYRGRGQGFVRDQRGDGRAPRNDRGPRGGPQHQQSETRAFDEGGNLKQNFSGSFEFRRGGGRPFVKQEGGRGAGGDRGGYRGTPTRPDRQFYQPPRQRRD